MSPTLDEALVWCARLCALSLALQTLELWQVRAACRDDGVWSWPLLKQEHAALPLPLRALFALLLPYRSYLLLLAVRLPLALALALGVLPAAGLLLVTQLALGARFRGTFNGGSDYMTVVVLLGLTLASTGRPLLAKAGLGYVCVQLVLSYFLAGTGKLLKPAWRNGEALSRLLSSNRYGTPDWLKRWSAHRAVALPFALAVLLFECGFPLALLGPAWALGLGGLGLAFHVGNVLAFGLNRFLFAWAAAYPALLYFSARLG